ncbi:hypothetical protein [Tenacibaculum geojense]|uniref:Adhesin domain-containing protein n=1 Tax=Tenacibaculum geojense TaxID=915352 RepID=A0ABW3JQV4_9FLAO
MKLFKYTLLLFFMSFSLIANTKKKHEKTKTIKKQYKVSSNATFFVSNKYGDVHVTTWDKNVIDITVKIKVTGGDVDKVEDKLNSITIDFEGNNSLVEARTRIESIKSNWSWWGNSNNVSYKINYYVNMPKTNNADLNNRYGNIEIDVLEGKANLNCDYGNIYAEKLLNNYNSIELDYCGNSEIEYMKSGTVNADYSKLEIGSSEKIKSNIDYTTLKVGKTKNIDFNSDYGSITINEADNITGNSDYAGMKIGTVYKNLKINTDYGSIKVRNLAKGFEDVTIDGSYAGIKIETPSDNNFNFIINIGYGGFNYPDDKVEIYKSIKKTTKKYYEGSFGNKNTSSNINIKSSYGSVSIKTNN